MTAPQGAMKREYPAAPILAVGVVVLDRDRILLIRRNKEPSMGLWTFPGGAVELGEGVRDAARREVCEETGLEVEIGEVATVVDAVHRDGHGEILYHYVILDFFARPIRGELQAGSDVSEVRWVGREEVESLPMTDQAQAMARELLDRSQLG